MPTTPQSKYRDRVYYFCCDLCKQLFDREPQKFAVEKDEKEEKDKQYLLNTSGRDQTSEVSETSEVSTAPVF